MIQVYHSFSTVFHEMLKVVADVGPNVFCLWHMHALNSASVVYFRNESEWLNCFDTHQHVLRYAAPHVMIAQEPRTRPRNENVQAIICKPLIFLAWMRGRAVLLPYSRTSCRMRVSRCRSHQSHIARTVVDLQFAPIVATI